MPLLSPDDQAPIPPIDYRALFTQYMQLDYRGLLVVGPRRRVLEMNQAARELLDYSGELPTPVTEVVRDVKLGFAVGQAFHDRQPVWHETYLPDPDRLLRLHLVPILEESGEALFIVVSIEDVTRLRHLETVRKDFVANVSHELRTPIASINLLVETLLNGAMDDPEAGGHFLHRIQVETMSMMRLVEELLELSRVESGALSLTLEETDVADALTGVVNRLAPLAREKEISVSIETQDGLPPVLADAKRLEQVLMNLVHNAIKFTPGEGQVSVRARRQGRGVLFEVTDTGVGMGPAEAARVFERFYKVDRGRSRAGGSGLGLAITRHLLEMHGTQLHVVSEPGRGSRFSFALPIAGDRSD